MLIITDTPQRWIDRVRTVYQIALEPMVMTPAEIAERLEIGDQFVAEIVEKGELLYAA